LSPVEVGRVTRAHGIRGEVRVQLHWAGSRALEAVDTVWLACGSDAPRAYRVEAARPVAKAVLLQLEGISERDAAERLRGMVVSLPREALPPLEPGEYYLCDLIGARVVGPEGDIGRVEEIRVHPMVDSLVVRTTDGRLLEQPLVEPWLDRVDLSSGVIHLTSAEGMI
jgi:16S rRNA processing protein RimM